MHLECIAHIIASWANNRLSLIQIINFGLGLPMRGSATGVTQRSTSKVCCNCHYRICDHNYQLVHHCIFNMIYLPVRTIG